MHERKQKLEANTVFLLLIENITPPRPITICVCLKQIIIIKTGGKTDNTGFIYFSHDSNKNITKSDGLQTNVDLKVNVF